MGAVVLTVSVLVTAVLPAIVADAGLIVQVGPYDALAGEEVMAQENVTAPVKPLVGVAVMVAPLPVVAPGATLMLPLLLSVSPGGKGLPVTVTVEVVLALMLPLCAETPVTVTTYVPPVVDAVLLTVSVEYSDAVPVTLTDAGERPHVTGLIAFGGADVIAQERLTTPR